MHSRRIYMSALMLSVVTMMAACKDSVTEPKIEQAQTCDTKWTSDWAGVWHFASEGRECKTDSLYESEQFDYSICAGDEVKEFFEIGPTTTCSINITSTKVTVNSSYTYADSSLGCKVTEQMTATLTRSGDTISATFEYREKTGANCPYRYAYCVRVTATGTRVSSACSATVVEGGTTLLRGVGVGDTR